MKEIDILIKELLTEDRKLSLLLIEAQGIADKLQDKELSEFIESELNGYTNKELPDYRKISGEIVGVVIDSFGRVIANGASIDFSAFSEQVGIDLSESQIFEGIGFIEDSLEGIKGQMVDRPLHNQLVKMLNDVVKYNHPQYNLVSASHRFPKANILFILTKVRQDLIMKLRKADSQKRLEVEDDAKTIQGKSVFVTYAWENEEHNDKVISFVNFLREKGYNASMDRKESQEETATNFNKMMIQNIQNSEKVIIVLSPKYKEKADTFTGGVGFEFGMVLEELKIHINKYIFVSFGTEKFEDITPLGIAGREILDLKKDQDQNEFNELFAKLDNKSTIVFSDVNEEKVEVKIKEIKPFKL
ncbi:SEFIR domain [Porphyromonas cangingivalis]|uniref:AbiTii domain-containing protein n=1 Tax=Porphyromonas cangingivalis TaxID=36874 RepID=UPI000D8872CD|nr:SEFIR domain-containing protein [Porphyromonas cangingivalis]SPY35874.1 SEFIR domain [Porphyromonas cangingivalis]